MLFESDNALLEQKIMWTRDTEFEGDGSRPEVADESSQFVIADDEDEDGVVPASENASSSPATPGPGAAQNSNSKSTRPTLAERLISCAIDLLFCCGFTLPSKIQVDHHKINYVIWYVV